MKIFRSARNIANLRQGRSDWYRIDAKAATPSVHIYDEIGYLGITAKDFVAELATIKADKIDLHLNTPGGDVFDGVAIYNALRQHPASIHVIVDSLAASIGSVIAMSGDEVSIARNGTMMIHDGFAMTIGNASDMRTMADLLDKTSDNLASIYAERSGKPAAHWRKLMRDESWFTGQEAVDAGLADKILNGASVDNTWDLSIFGRYAPEDGAMGVHHTGTEDKPWDGGAAEKAYPADPAVLRAVYAWHDTSGDPASKSSYKFPHHHTKGGPANLAAVRNGLARLSEADIPDGDKAGVARHLRAHLDDAKPSDQITWDDIDPQEILQALKGVHRD